MRTKTLATIGAAALAVAMPVALTQAAPQSAAGEHATKTHVSPHCACSCTHVTGGQRRLHANRGEPRSGHSAETPARGRHAGSRLRCSCSRARVPRGPHDASGASGA